MYKEDCLLISILLKTNLEFVNISALTLENLYFYKLSDNFSSNSQVMKFSKHKANEHWILESFWNYVSIWKLKMSHLVSCLPLGMFEPGPTCLLPPVFRNHQNKVYWDQGWYQSSAHCSASAGQQVLKKSTSDILIIWIIIIECHLREVNIIHIQLENGSWGYLPMWALLFQLNTVLPLLKRPF